MSEIENSYISGLLYICEDLVLTCVFLLLVPMHQTSSNFPEECIMLQKMNKVQIMHVQYSRTSTFMWWLYWF